MRPKNLKTRIFLDSGDPEQTKEILGLMGFLDGQTTNPSLITKNPEAKKRIEEGNKFSKKEINDFYKKVVTEISELLPGKSVSIEVYADKETSVDSILEQAEEMSKWIPSPHIKLPIIPSGLEAAKRLVEKGNKVNLTLNFSQQQGGAVYAATKGASKGDVFISPFEGRLHDNCKDGTDLITNLQKMYRENGDGHVEVLAASVRDYAHFMYLLYAEVDIITAPYKVLKDWVQEGMKIPGQDIDKKVFEDENTYFKNIHDKCVEDIPYEEMSLDKNWEEYDITHELTDKGLQKFADDWNAIIND